MIQRDKINTYLDNLKNASALLDQAVFGDKKLSVKAVDFANTRYDASMQIVDNLYFMDKIGRECFIWDIIVKTNISVGRIAAIKINGSLNDFYVKLIPSENKELLSFWGDAYDSYQYFAKDILTIMNNFQLKLKPGVEPFKNIISITQQSVKNSKIIFKTFSELADHVQKMINAGFIDQSQRERLINQLSASSPDKSKLVDVNMSNTKLIYYMTKLTINGKRNVAYAKKIFDRPDLKDGDYKGTERIPDINKLFK